MKHRCRHVLLCSSLPCRHRGLGAARSTSTPPMRRRIATRAQGHRRRQGRRPSSNTARSTVRSARVDELAQVKGIGQKLIDRNRADLRIDRVAQRPARPLRRRPRRSPDRPRSAVTATGKTGRQRLQGARGRRAVRRALFTSPAPPRRPSIMGLAFCQSRTAACKSEIRTAVFPVAGRGTRFLPATKASPKEMLPVVDKPLIQYAVEEALAAGRAAAGVHHRRVQARHRRSLRLRPGAREAARVAGQDRPAAPDAQRAAQLCHLHLHPPAGAAGPGPRGAVRRGRGRAASRSSCTWPTT